MRILQGGWQFIHITNWGYYATTQLRRKDLIKDPITRGKEETAEQPANQATIQSSLPAAFQSKLYIMGVLLAALKEEIHEKLMTWTGEGILPGMPIGMEE